MTLAAALREVSALPRDRRGVIVLDGEWTPIDVATFVRGTLEGWCHAAPSDERTRMGAELGRLLDGLPRFADAWVIHTAPRFHVEPNAIN
jgi:hypothetical protein